jgi:ribosomal protein S7
MKHFRDVKNHFICSLIWRGRKVAAENFFTSTLMHLKKLNVCRPLNIFYYALLSLRPLVFLRPLKRGSVTYRVPVPISVHRRRLYAIKFVFQAVKDARGSITVDRISTLLNVIYNSGKNPASDKKIALYREALSNRSFIRRLRLKL